MHESQDVFPPILHAHSTCVQQGERFVKRELLDGERFAEREAREVEFDLETGLRSFGRGFTILEGDVQKELTREEQVRVAPDFLRRLVQRPSGQRPRCCRKLVCRCIRSGCCADPCYQAVLLVICLLVAVM